MNIKAEEPVFVCAQDPCRRVPLGKTQALRTHPHSSPSSHHPAPQSVCYNVPVLEALAAHPDACALYLFPTKARRAAAGRTPLGSIP
jgi:hypothetical protein